MSARSGEADTGQIPKTSGGKVTRSSWNIVRGSRKRFAPVQAFHEQRSQTKWKTNISGNPTFCSTVIATYFFRLHFTQLGLFAAGYKLCKWRASLCGPATERTHPRVVYIYKSLMAVLEKQCKTHTHTQWEI